MKSKERLSSCLSPGAGRFLLQGLSCGKSLCILVISLKTIFDKRRMSSWRCWCCLSCFPTLTLSLLCLQECMPGPAVPWGAAVVPEGFCCRFWMMSEQDLADVVQIAVEDLTPDNPGRKRFPAVPMDWRSLLSFSLKYKPGVYSKSCFWSPCPMISRASLVYLPNPLDQIILFISLFS